MSVRCPECGRFATLEATGLWGCRHCPESPYPIKVTE